MTVKELKEKLDKLPDAAEVLVACHATSTYDGLPIICAYDSPHDATFMYSDNKLLICGYDADESKQSIRVKDLEIEKFDRL